MILKKTFMLGADQPAPKTMLPLSDISQPSSNLSPMLGFAAVATILLPAHPSLQAPLVSLGIPSTLISVIFAIPVIYAIMSKRLFSRSTIIKLLPFIAYIAWLLIRMIGSSALGQANNLASIRGIVILMPLALLCALVAGRSSPFSAKIIGLFGLVALSHYLLLQLTGGFDDVSGFRSLSPGSNLNNYQTTSFYIGFVGVASLPFIVLKKGWLAIIGVCGVGLVLTVMGAVGARSAIVALVISLMFVIIFAGSIKTVLFLICAGSACLLILMIAFTLGLFDSLTLSDLTVVNRFTELAEEGDSSSRIYLFSFAINMWMETLGNFLFGGGVGVYPEFIGESEPGWYPHNFILESLAEGGLVAGLILLWIGYEFAKKIYRISKYSSIEEIYLGALSIYSLISYQFMGGLHTLWIPTFFIGLFMFWKKKQVT